MKPFVHLDLPMTTKPSLCLSRGFRDILINQLIAIRDLFKDRVYPVFSNPEEETKNAMDEMWNNFVSQPCGEDEYYSIDLASEAASLQEWGYERYQVLSLMRYRTLAMWISCICQVWEQQVIKFIIKESELSGISFDRRNIERGFEFLKCSLKSYGVELNELSSWHKIDELRQLVNTIKHSEGGSANRLRDLRPDYFVWEDADFSKDTLQFHGTTLLDETLRISIDDFTCYCDALADFWNELPKDMEWCGDDLPVRVEIKSSIPIDKGWSGDEKYHATDADGEEYFLRISPYDRRDNRKELYKMTRRLEDLGVPMCRPLGFGDWEKKKSVYSVYSWINGVDLRDMLMDYSEAKRYQLGVKSGEILRRLHTIPAPDGTEDWAARYNRKVDKRIEVYKNQPLRFDGDGFVLGYLAQNRGLLAGRPQCFQHGDYHEGNMMLAGGDLQIIDFDRYDFGDPWEEFNRITFSAALSPHFATGQLDGYFGGKPPMEFFRLMAFYIGANALASLPWAADFGQGEVDTMLRQAKDVLEWFDNMRNPVPTWYLDCNAG